MFDKLGLKSGDTVMVVDDQESYSTGLADIVGQNLSGKGVKVDRESISQKATDFSSLVAKVTSATKVVYLPFQLASEAQLFAQQLKAQGKTAIVFGSDGTFDSSKFTVNGSYISFFAPDVTTIKADASIVAAFNKQFPGGTSPFGAPNYVLAQMYASAITTSLQGREDHPGRASEELRQGVVEVDDPRYSDPVHGERRSRRRQVPHLQDRQRQVRDGPVARRPEGARPHACGRAPFSVCKGLRMNWNLFVTELTAGITHGCVYALIALGYSMVYGILKLLNFAHGDIYMVGAYIGLGIITVFGGATNVHVNVVLMLFLMFAAAMLGGGLLGVMIERFAYRRLRSGAANRAAHHRARRLLLPRERSAAHPRRAAAELQQLQLAERVRSR